MRNITLTVPDEVYRAARVRAAEQGTSVSAMVREYLVALSEQDQSFLDLEALQQSVLAEVASFRAGDRLARDDVHDRALR